MVAEVSLNKTLHKVVLYLIKTIPIIIAGIYLLNTILSYFYIDLPIFSYIVQYLFIGFLYLTSITFKFCKWHRVFIHYLFIILTLNIVDYHIGIPITNRGILTVYIIITSLSIFTIIYYKLNKR